MGGIIRVQKSDGDWFMSLKKPFETTTLSWEARGLFGYLMTKPPGWEIRNEDLINKGPAKAAKLERMLDELKMHGLVRRVRYRKPDGTFDYVSEVYESPETNPDFDNLPEIQKKVLQKQRNRAARRERWLKKQAALAATVPVLDGGGATVPVFSVHGSSVHGSSVHGKDGDIVRNKEVRNYILTIEGPVEEKNAEAIREIEALYTQNFGPLRGTRNETAAEDLKKTLVEYGCSQVLDAIKAALAPERRNGRPRTWGYVKGILENRAAEQEAAAALEVRPETSKHKGDKTKNDNSSTGSRADGDGDREAETVVARGVCLTTEQLARLDAGEPLEQILGGGAAGVRPADAPDQQSV